MCAAGKDELTAVLRMPVTTMPKNSQSRFLIMLPDAVILAGIWWLLTGGNPASWIVGVPVVLAATAFNVGKKGALRFRPWRLACFAGYFLYASLRGGLDVTRRVLLPALPIYPDHCRYRLQLSPGPARNFFTAVVSLLPGTLSVELEQDHLVVHAIDFRSAVTTDLQRMEWRVADLYAIHLPTRAGGHDV